MNNANREKGTIRLEQLNNHQLVQHFNKYTAPKEMTDSTGLFLRAIVKELIHRRIDCSKIWKETESILYEEKYRVFLLHGALHLREEHSPTISVVIHYKDGSFVTIECEPHFLDDPFVSLKNIKGDRPLLLVIGHGQLQTHIDASGLIGHRLAAFDHADLFTAVSVLNSDKAGTFGLISQARTAVIFRPEELEFHTGIECISL